MKTRAPSSGYDHDEKWLYRRWVWRFFKRYLGRSIHDARVVFMPGPSLGELEVARRAGARDERLIAVDHNAANVAMLTARGFRGQTIGLSIDRAFDERISGEIDAIHLDLTSPCSPQAADAIISTAGYSRLADLAGLVVNIQRGRESTDVFETFMPRDLANRLLKPSDDTRHDKVKLAIGDALEVSDAARFAAVWTKVLDACYPFHRAIPHGIYIYKSEGSKVSMIACAFYLFVITPEDDIPGVPVSPDIRRLLKKIIQGGGGRLEPITIVDRIRERLIQIAESR